MVHHLYLLIFQRWGSWASLAVAAVPSPAEISTEHISNLPCCCWADYTVCSLYMPAVTHTQLKHGDRKRWHLHATFVLFITGAQHQITTVWSNLIQDTVSLTHAQYHRCHRSITMLNMNFPRAYAQLYYPAAATPVSKLTTRAMDWKNYCMSSLKK